MACRVLLDQSLYADAILLLHLATDAGDFARRPELAIRCRASAPSYLQGHSALSRASSRHSGGTGLLTGSDPDSAHGSAHLTRATCGPRFSRLRLQTHGSVGPGGRKEGQHSLVKQPRRLTGISRTTSIGWLQRVSGVRRPHVTSGLPAPRPLFQSTSRQASVRETPNAEARDCSST
jgi:hypothetical protein